MNCTDCGHDIAAHDTDRALGFRCAPERKATPGGAYDWTVRCYCQGWTVTAEVGAA